VAILHGCRTFVLAITLPVELRRQYDLKEEDILTLFDLGDGSFLLTL
jgi:bifunctional DNA-binding transcriptional regulator/antitoxin component of YhaV-PrlF toxin-antitoxin module